MHAIRLRFCVASANRSWLIIPAVKPGYAMRMYAAPEAIPTTSSAAIATAVDRSVRSPSASRRQHAARLRAVVSERVVVSAFDQSRDAIAVEPQHAERA